MLFFHALFVASISFILRGYKGFTFKSTLIQMQRHSVIKEFSNFIVIEDHTPVNYVIAISYVFTVVIKDVLINYAALFYGITIYGLVIISRNFRESCRNNKDVKQTLMEYRTICRLTRYHDKFYGCG